MTKDYMIPKPKWSIHSFSEPSFIRHIQYSLASPLNEFLSTIRALIPNNCLSVKLVLAGMVAMKSGY